MSVIDILSSSGIDRLIQNYTTIQQRRRIQPLSTKKSGYEAKNNAYSNLSSKLSSLKTLLEDFKSTGTSSEFKYKEATSSDDSFVTASATTSAGIGSYDMRISQLAKADLAISKDIDTSSTGANSLGITTGTYKFTIKTGDGSTGEYVSNVSVSLSSTDSNETVMTKIRDAINSDKAVVESTAKSGDYTGGATSFDINVNGTTTTISDDGGGTYSDLFDRLVSQINSNVDGVTAEKVDNGGTYQLKITVDNTDNYISISNKSGFDIVSDLNIGVTKEKGASGIVTASVYSPSTGTSQFSITSKETGLDYRIKELSDASGNALDVLGLNLGTSRPTYDQSTSPDTPGYLYSDVTEANNQLNAKLTFNGVEVQRNSNTISDLVTGVTFSLKSAMSSTDKNVTVSVANDVDTVKSKIQDFIDKFNDVYTYIKSNSLDDNGTRGPFLGDALPTTLKTNMTNYAYSEVSGLDSGALNKLSEIGITFTTDGGLTISDDSELEDQIKNNIDEVEDLFNSTNGIANKLYDLIDPYVGTGGYLHNLEDSYDSNITYLDDRIKSIQKQIDKSADTLRSKYEKMQQQLVEIMAAQNLMNQFSQGFF
jgi:flagellar hook-associated protein 2